MDDYNLRYGPQLDYPKSSKISELEQLLNEFQSHEGQEGKFVERYKEIAEKSENPLIKFLLQLIISDEEKHHAMTHTMVSTLKSDLYLFRTKPEDAILGLYELGKEKDELLKLTEDFIQVEKKGIKEYKNLVKTSKGYYNDLFVLLFQSMIHDSEKHVDILEFIQQRLKEA